MTEEKFKQEIYAPYVEAWKIAKLLQYLDETSDPDALWEKVVKVQNRLADTYGCTPYIVALCNLINAVAKKIEESKHEKC
jgi:hypothetical protein